MTKLVRIWLEDMDEEQLSWLQKYARTSWDRMSLKDLLYQAKNGDLAIWTITDSPARGLVGTRLHQGNAGPILWLEFLCGEGLLNDAIAIRLAIHELRKAVGATSLEGIVSRPGLARLYERVLGVKPSAQIFREEF